MTRRLTLLALAGIVSAIAAQAAAQNCRFHLAGQYEWEEKRGFYLAFEGCELAELPIVLGVADGENWRFISHDAPLYAGESYAVRACGKLHVSGDVGKLPMLLDALGTRSVYACALNEHRLMGDYIEEVGDDLPWEGRLTFLRTCTGVARGEVYQGGVGLLLSPAASRRWRNHGRVASLGDLR